MKPLYLFFFIANCLSRFTSRFVPIVIGIGISKSRILDTASKLLIIILAVSGLSTVNCFAQNYTIDQGGSIGTCSGNFYDSGGNGGDYDTSEFYIMTFCSDDVNPSTCLRISFTSFDLENGVDYLYIYDGFSVTNPVIATLTGNSIPSSVISTTGCLTFKFVSNDTINGSGWRGSFSCVPCPTDNICAGEPVSTCSGSFYDSGGPTQDYGNNESCVRTYCTSGSNCIAVSFTSFNIENGADFLYVYDGPSVGSPLLVTLTGSSIPAPILSSTGCLTFEFSSNSSVTASGWTASFSCSQCPALPGGGSGTMSETYNNINCGLNFVQTTHRITSRSAGLPGVGLPATYNISGLPATCITIERGILWWSESSGNTSAVITVTNPLGNTSSYTSQIIGTGVDKCWGEPASQSFRADITQSVTGNGNYTINISSGDYAVDGATLFIIYRDMNATYEGHFILWDGNLAYNSGVPSGLTLTGFNACANSTSATAFVMGGDLQIAGTCPAHTSTLNGAPISYPNEFWNNDMTSTSITAGQSSASFGIAPCSNDCYVWVSMGLYYQTTTCTTCPPVTNFPTTTFQNNISCAGDCDGEAVVVQTGGMPPYTYTWNSIPVQNTPIATGLCPGIYTVTVTDASGCSSPISITDVTITSAPPFTSTMTQVDVSCFGNNDGQATVSASGGTPGYVYAWDDPSNQTTTTATGLYAGTYTVTITDNMGCTNTNSVTINQPPATMSITITVISNYNGEDVSCFGASDGSASASASGGTPGYSYLWSDGQTAATATGLSAGTYSVTATDANGCTVIGNLTINDPPLLTAPVAVTSDFNGQDVSCNGASDGEATASPTGGTGAYTYLWNTIPVQIIAVATGLSAGTYDVTVTDANGCDTTVSITLTQPDTLLSTAAVTSNYNGEDVSCNGACDGAATASPIGGTAPYSYLWDDPGAQTTATATGLCDGTFNVTVIDANGCMTAVNITLTEPPLLAATTAVTSDYNGQDVSCNGASDGEAAVYPSGGTGAFTYLWDANAGNQNTDTAAGLSAGTYNITVTDANGCNITVSITITEPDPLPIPIAITSNYNGENISCYGLCDGEATAMPTGGTPPYTYLWNDPNTQTDSIANGLCAITYSITVTDANGCITIDSITLIDPPLLTATTAVTSNFNGEDVSCYGFDDGEATVTPAGGTGAYTYLWDNGDTSAVADTLPAGTYDVLVTDVNGCDTIVSIILTEPPPLTSTTMNDTLCSGSAQVEHYCDGEATVLVNGGTGAYTYLWSNGQTAFLATDLCVGDYNDTITVIVTDVNGCIKGDTVIIYSYGHLEAIFTAEPDPDQIPLQCTSTEDSIVSEIVPLRVLFTDESELDDSPGIIDYIETWEWDFGDENISPIGEENTSDEQNPSHTYYFEGTYEVTMIITTNNGCTDTMIYRYIVVKENLNIPNVFTPNDDDINDFFNVFGANLKEMDGMIFNRWGQKVYSWTSPKASWDGRTNNGNEVPEGTYFYIIKAEGMNGTGYELTGTVTLIR
ncbi:MAG: CUB domain-containing protein [Bacteroidota bacterium]